MKTINIKLNSFEGPFDLLFHLIEKNKIDIYDIPIFSLTSQYMKYMENLENIDMDSLSEFLVMAATLLEIKSRMLLPNLETAKGDEAEDPREALVTKLLEYKFYKEIASILDDKQNHLDTIYFKNPEQTVIELAKKKEPSGIAALFSEISLDFLYSLYKDILNRRELKTDKIRSRFSYVARDLFTVEDKIKHIKNLLFLNGALMFSKIFKGSSSKSEKITTFLAMLELIRMNQVEILQLELFEDIEIRRIENAYDKI